MQDCVGSDHMTAGSLYTFTSDRNGLTNDAISLNGGYTNFPADVYFNSAFTISAWVNPNNLGIWSRIIDFGAGASIYNVLLTFNAGSSNDIALHLYSNGNPIVLFQPSYQLPWNTWSFVAVTYNGYTATIYINGGQIASQTNAGYWVPENVVRSQSYCGRSEYSVDEYSDSLIDQIQIYNRALSSGEISTLYSYTN